MTSSISKAGTPLSSIFDPYVSGTKARVTGIQDNGSEISNLFAPIYLGSAAAATGIDSEGADLNTLYSAYGTASYALPINGTTYHQTCTIPLSDTGLTQIGFKITSGTTWAVYGSPSYGTPIAGASGPVPSGSVNIKVTYGTYSVPSGSTDAGGGVTNPAASAVAISTNPNTYYATGSVGSASGTRSRSYPVTIIFYNSVGTAISTTNITLIGETDGSS